jgi:hypothetical protein
MVLLTANLYLPSPECSSCCDSRLLGAGEVSAMRACRMLLIIALFQAAVLSCW